MMMKKIQIYLEHIIIENKKILKVKESKAQKQLHDISEYSNRNEIKVKIKKTKVMLFNIARKNIFTSALKVSD